MQIYVHQIRPHNYKFDSTRQNFGILKLLETDIKTKLKTTVQRNRNDRTKLNLVFGLIEDRA